MKFKKSIIFVLVLTIMSSVFIIRDYADVSRSDKCGENAFYSFSDGVLVISGG